MNLRTEGWVLNNIFKPRLQEKQHIFDWAILYSTGKTTFIRHLLERDYPGVRIGPEPTTDKFHCIIHGRTDKIIPGNALVVDKSLPFSELSNFGNNFLTRLECVQMRSDVLEGLSFIDTPGW